MEQPGRETTTRARLQVSIPALETEKWESFDVSNIVARSVSGQAPNLGLLIKSDNEAQVNYDFTVLASNDFSPAPGVRPQLQVNLHRRQPRHHAHGGDLSPGARGHGFGQHGDPGGGGLESWACEHSDCCPSC